MSECIICGPLFKNSVQNPEELSLLSFTQRQDIEGGTRYAVNSLSRVIHSLCDLCSSHGCPYESRKIAITASLEGVARQAAGDPMIQRLIAETKRSMFSQSLKLPIQAFLAASKEYFGLQGREF